MEKQLEKLKSGAVSFQAGNKSVLGNDDRTLRAHKPSLANEAHSVHYGQSLESPENPGSAMKFLSRSWSPCASSILQMFSSSHLLAACDSNSIEDHEEQLVEKQKHGEKRHTVLAINNSRKMDFNQVKGWLKGRRATGLFRSCKEKRKEEIRFQTANLHAALSLTKVAAAVAGFASNASDINHVNNVEARALYEGTGGAVATAATLVTTVCAEAAESLGADRSQVASAVNSGLAISTPIDMMALTAAAATCLRGAAILKSRMMADSSPGVRDTLQVCSQICIITPSGDRECKYVTMYSKQKQVILCFQKKYFGGTLTTAKKYKVLSIEETMEGEGYFFLSLKTNNGTIKLLLEDEKQLRTWISTISNLLKMQDPCHMLANMPFQSPSSNSNTWDRI